MPMPPRGPFMELGRGRIFARVRRDTYLCLPSEKKKERNGKARMFGLQRLAGVRLRVDKRVKKLNAGQASAKLGGCLRLDRDGARGEKKWCQARTHTVSCNLQTTEVLGTCCGSLNGDLAVDGSLNGTVGASLFVVQRWCGWKEMEQVRRTLECINFLNALENNLTTIKDQRRGRHVWRMCRRACHSTCC